MLIARTTVRLLIVVAALISLVACDDEEKKTKYEITISVSEHINIDKDIIQVVTGGPFNKPRVVVQAPEGVDVKHDETKPRTGKLVDFAPIALPAIIILVLATALRSGCVHPPRIRLQV